MIERISFVVLRVDDEGRRRDIALDFAADGFGKITLFLNEGRAQTRVDINADTIGRRPMLILHAIKIDQLPNEFVDARMLRRS